MQEIESKQIVRSCENCGNYACRNSLIAFWWDDCVDSNFERHWRPEQKPQKEE